MSPVTVPPAELARDACARMSESQRIAFAIELANGVRSHDQAPGLMRLGRVATNIAEDLYREQFLSECG